MLTVATLSSFLMLTVATLAVSTSVSQAQAPINQQQPVVALTFDDLPAAGSLPAGMNRTKVTQQLADELKAEHMEGTYAFVIGSKIGSDPDAQQSMRVWLAAGMNIGSHTWSHPALTNTAATDYIADVEKNEQPMAEWGQMRDWKWFRYPYLWEGETLEKRLLVRDWLKTHGYRVAQVTLDFEDYAWNDAYGRCLAKADQTGLGWLHDSYLANARDYVRLGRAEEKIVFGHEIPNVLLLHATPFTTHMLPELIGALRAEGFRFESLRQVEEDPAYALDPDFPLKYGGTLPDQFMDSRKLPYPAFQPKPFDELKKLCQ